MRRGDTAAEKCSKDLVELVLYICGFTDYFPREALSSRSTYIEIDNQVPDDVNKNSNSTQNHWKKDCSILINSLREKWDVYERSLNQLRDYVLSVEKAHAEQILQLKNEMLDIKGLIENAGSGGSTSRSREYADAARVNAKPGQTRPVRGQSPGEAVNPGIPPSQRRESQAPTQPTTVDLRSPGQDRSLTSMLADNPSSHRPIPTSPQNDDGAEDADIQCGQPSREVPTQTSESGFSTPETEPVVVQSGSRDVVTRRSVATSPTIPRGHHGTEQARGLINDNNTGQINNSINSNDSAQNMRTASTQHKGRVGQHSDAGTSPMVLQQPRRTGHTDEPAASERPGDGADWV